MVPVSSEIQTGKLNIKWLFLYLLVCLVTVGICVVGSIAWWFKGGFHENLFFCGLFINFSVILCSTSLLFRSKRTARGRKNISTRNFLQIFFEFLGSKVSVGSFTYLVGVSLLLFGMVIWKSYSQFLGVWIGVASASFMVVMPLLQWTDRRQISGNNKGGNR